LQCQAIQAYSDTVFSSLRDEDYLKALSKKQFTARAAHYFSEINTIHPFREGKGRVQRLLMSQLAEYAEFSISYAALGRTEMYSVMESAFFGNEKLLPALLFYMSEKK
jgi:cell filamentation protein